VTRVCGLVVASSDAERLSALLTSLRWRRSARSAHPARSLCKRVPALLRQLSRTCWLGPHAP